jgi:sugar lactone lactonase YvrE
MPFFSPDGRSVAFFARGRLYRWNTAGGTVQTLADAPMPAGGTWSEDGTIVFVPVWNGGLYQISVSGGAPELLMRPDGKKEYAFVYPQFVPGRQEVVFTGWGSTNRIVRADLLRHNQSTVLPAGRAVTVTTSGHLLFSTGESSISGLLAEPYASSRPMQETSTVVLAGIHEALGARRLWLSVSRNGVLAYVPTDITRRTLVLVDQTGRLEPFAEQSGLYGSVALARNGRTIAADTEYRIWIYEPGQRGAVRLAPENRDAEESSPVWAPDGSRVFYASNQGGNVDIYARVVGTPRSEVILQKESNQSPDAIAPDGTLALRDTRPKTGADIWLLPPGGTATPWLATAAQEVHSDFSPDGRWLAYASDESGRSEVYVRAVRGEGRSIQLSTEGGREPAWSPQGGRLYYRQGSTMMAVDVTGRDVLTVGRPRRVFDGGWELRPAELPTMRTYAVAPDGEHFIMVRHDPEAIPNRINIVLNWLEELKVKVPVARD